MKTAILMLNLIEQHGGYSYNYETKEFVCGDIIIIVDNDTYRKVVDFNMSIS